MSTARTRSMTPDPFSQAGQTSQLPTNSPNTDAAPSRHVLPKDLPRAIKQLTNGELDELFSAVLTEQKRRRLPTSDKSARNRQVEEAPLTLGRLNAVRAAFSAGITPSQIARQFGLSQSQVRKALTSR